MECRLLFQFFHAVHEIAGTERCINRYIHLRTKTSIEIPSPNIIYMIYTLQRYAEVMYGLLLTDGVPVSAYLRF